MHIWNWWDAHCTVEELNPRLSCSAVVHHPEESGKAHRLCTEKNGDAGCQRALDVVFGWICLSGITGVRERRWLR
jgi:hypothetical protein